MTGEDLKAVLLGGPESQSDVYIDHKPAGHARAGKHNRMTGAAMMAMVAMSDEGEGQ